jgi:dihydrofolate synthase/folylpolyglutamate synthase
MQQTTGSFAPAHEILKSFPVADARMVRTLEHVTELMDFLGHPQNKLRVIHVAGAAHKAPVIARLAGRLHAQGARIGIAFERRLYAGLKAIDGAEYHQTLEEFLAHVQHSGLALMRDEVFAAFQYWYFGRRQFDFVVVGAGNGGLLDPTNTVTRSDKMCVISDADDETAEHIAGIIQPRNAVFCSAQAPPVQSFITRVAQQKQADLHMLSDHEALVQTAAGWALDQER